ncbi:MAG: hypothetical protein IIC99_07605 [Chloroflexi bacterium]|nr:hypothetical protein [Chloroflexota bacterium]
MRLRTIKSPKVFILTPLVMVLLFALACGTSAPAQPAASEAVVSETPKEVVKETVKDVPVEKTKIVVDAPASAGQVPPTIVPGAKADLAEQAPAVAIPAGKYGGFINMNDYADVRQRLIGQSGVLNKNLTPMFNNLVEFNPETPDFNDLRCDLCTSWELAADGVTYTFHLNPKAKWWDGTPVTAKDIVFSLEAQINPDQFEILEGRSTSSTVNTPLYLTTGTCCRAIDDLTVEVITDFPSGAFLTALSIEQAMIQAEHVVIGQGIKQGGADLEGIMGSGPFKFVEYIKEVSTEYVKNDDYWKDGLPYIDGMKHFIMLDSGRIIAAYKTGQILTSNQYGYNLSNPEALQLDKDMDNLTVYWGPADFARYVMMNTTKAPFDNPDVRKAVHLALDRVAVLDSLAAGQGIQGYPLPSGEWYSNTDEEYANMPGFRLVNGKKDPRDIEDAKAALARAGLDGPLKFTLNARNCCGYPDVVILVKEQLKAALGWDITIETLESGAGFDKYWAGDFTMAVQGGSLWSSDPDAIGSRFTRGSTPQWVGGGRGKRWVPPGMDELYEAQQRESDQEKRKVLVQKMGAAMLADSASPYIYYSRRYWAVENRIQNFNFTSEGRAWEHIWCDPAC